MISISLVVAAGPDLGRRVSLGSAPITIGRGEGEDLRLSDGSVSRHHLCVALSTDPAGNPVAVVQEIAGVNPVWTLHDGQRMVVTVGYALPLDASLTLGNSTLTLTADGKAANAPGPKKISTLEVDARLPGEPEAPRRLAALAALGDRLARCSSLQSVLREATQWAIKALPASRALLLSPDGSDILAAAAEGTIADLALSRGLLARVLAERRAFLVLNVLDEPDLADRRSVQVRGIQGAMAAPAANLVFYAEWGAEQAVAHPYGEAALDLMVCAAHLVSALGQNATERSQLKVAAKVRKEVAPALVGQAATMQRLQVFIERVAQSPATVLLRGESGTGKELAAALVHAKSSVCDGPFVAVNCAAIPEQLLESELFGHEKGAFTGAVSQHNGVFSRADGGTLFLDEIGEMSLATQARMLRVLETRSFTRVGGTQEINVSVRLVAATHRDLRAMVEAGTFRQDLLYRLSVIHTELPPLRDRVEDIEELVEHFVESLGGQLGRRIERIAPEALAVLQRYRWPGNVRELRNVVERALVLGDGSQLELDDLPPELLHVAPPPGAQAPVVGTVLPLAEVEAQAIQAALVATGGNKARAAALLGIDRTTLYRKLRDAK